jgi:spermidine synthase
MFLHYLLAVSALITDPYQETLYPEWVRTFAVEKVVHEEKTEMRDLVIFENGQFGRVLALNGAIQLTEKDGFISHEMMTHVPILAHGQAKSVLILGGADGGLLREALKHESVEKIVLVEMDPTLIELSKEYFPNISEGAFDHPKAKVVIQDAAEYVKAAEERFDIIICDRHDLMTAEFYADCKRALHPNGIFVNRNGIPFLQKKELQISLKNRKPYFKNVQFYVAAIPSCLGGFIAIGFASDKKHKVSEKVLQERLVKVKEKMGYYTPGIHKGSFALPSYMLD